MKKYSVVQLQSFFIVYPYGKQCCLSALELFHCLLPLFHCLPLWTTVRLQGKKLQNATNLYYHLLVHCNVQSASINILWSARICFQKAFDQVLSHLLGLNDTNRMWQSCSPFTCSSLIAWTKQPQLKSLDISPAVGYFYGTQFEI